MSDIAIPPLVAPPTPTPPRRAPLPFSAWRFYGFAAILALLLATAGALGLRGLNLGLDFTGGVVVQAVRGAPFAVDQVRGALSTHGLGEAVVQLDAGGTAIYVRSELLPAAEAGSGATAAESPTLATVAAIRDALGPEAKILKSESVGAKVSDELLRKGLIATGLAVCAIAVYVWLRFEAKFGWAALITTFHDVIAVIGLFAITGMTFDLSSIAAMLAIAGYSINDTVIIFDRIRETLGRDQSATLASVIDRSITDTLRRTLATSGTTLATSVALLIFGGPVLFGFAAAITYGVVIGTVSSIVVAAPMLLYLPGRLPGRPEASDASDAEAGAEPQA